MLEHVVQALVFLDDVFLVFRQQAAQHWDVHVGWHLTVFAAVERQYWTFGVGDVIWRIMGSVLLHGSQDWNITLIQLLCCRSVHHMLLLPLSVGHPALTSTSLATMLME